MKKLKTERVNRAIITGIIILTTLVIFYPLYFVIIASFSDPYEIVRGNVTFWVKGFSVEGYKQVFLNKDIWIGYKNSIVNTLMGTLLSLLLTIPAAYALSKPYLPHRNILIAFFVITMLFSGGLLPTYLVVRDLGLINKPYTLIVLGAFSVYNLLVAKTYFQYAISPDVFEAAEIDGCSQIQSFIHIALPLAKPMIAVVALYYSVAHWNEFSNALIYISDKEYYPLQLVLRNMIIGNQSATIGSDISSIGIQEMTYLVKKAYLSETMKYSAIILASLPMWIVFPFVQKHFTKNALIGATKE